MAKVIRVPKTPKSAYDPSRKVSTLLKAHIANLEAVTHRKLGVTPSKKPKTEAQASAYIASLTQQLHPAVAPPVFPGPPVPTGAPYPVMPAPPTVRRRAQRSSRRAVKATRPRRRARMPRAKRTLGAKK